jgi:germacradienol/geosmin synthase
VLVAQNFLDCDAAEGMRVVGEVMAARMQQFQRVTAVELPALIAAMDLGSAVGDALHDHARHLQNWLSGILNWRQGCHRYTEADLIRNTRPASASFGDLTGLGTSAARITVIRRPEYA